MGEIGGGVPGAAQEPATNGHTLRIVSVRTLEDRPSDALI